MSDPIDSIDEIDRKILNLVAQRVAQQRDSLTESGKIESAHEAGARIEAIVRTVATSCEIEGGRLTALLKHVTSICNAQLRATQIALLGPLHSYSHQAAIKYFGEATPFSAEPTIADVFDAVVRGRAAQGIVPVENSTDGRVIDTLSMFVQNPVNICGEVLLPIHHCLLSKSPRESIREIYSKPQALSQCRDWLARHMPGADLKDMSSSAAAAALAAENEGVAAIASAAAAREHNLDVIAEKIEDNPNNVTRFAILGEHQPEPTGNDKTALLLQVNHRPGALAEVMNVFKDRGLNLTWIESYPMPQTPSEYLFFVELEGHRNEAAIRSSLTELNAFTIRCDVLGSFPRDSAGG